MFGEKERPLRMLEQNTTTLLDRGCQFEGKLTFEGNVQINGKFRGEIFSDGTLVIGEGADVEGTIEIDTVVISGQVNGTIHAKRKIEMNPPAIVRGDITAPALVIQEGAFFEGNCSMGKKVSGTMEQPTVYEMSSNDS
jgi:cytoskeletal protein CcmA (bactofilin family)